MTTATIRSASATWRGGFQDGGGEVRLKQGAYEGKYSMDARFEDGPGTNPEELLGAAHASCYSMALAKVLQEAERVPESITTEVEVQLSPQGAGFEIGQITIHTSTKADGLGEQDFRELAEKAEKLCIVSNALRRVPIKLEAKISSR